MKKWLKRFRRRRSRRPGMEHLRTGDAARDARDWPRAEAAYGRFLAINPANAAIWVQRGHACKEAGDLARAERCYRHAADLDPNQGDSFLHLAHLLRSMGRAADARESCTRAAALGDPRALADLTSFGVTLGHRARVIGELRPWITTNTAARLLAGAQAKRDSREWEESEAMYLAYLSARPMARQVERELEFVRAMATISPAAATAAKLGRRKD